MGFILSIVGEAMYMPHKKHWQCVLLCAFEDMFVVLMSVIVVYVLEN